MRTAVLKRTMIVCSFDWDPALVEKIRKVEDRSFNKATKQWTLRPSLKAIEFLVDNNFSIPTADINRLVELVRKFQDQDSARSAKAKLAKSLDAAPIPEVENLMRIPAYHYQWVPSHFARLCNGRFLLADEMACGKSVESLMICNLPEYQDKPVLIITPVPYTFQEEIQKFFGKPAVVIDSPFYYLNPRVRYYLITDYQFKQLFDNPKMFIPRPFIGKFFVIVDEAHRYKNEKSQRSKFLRIIAGLCPHVILMTGTPVMNRPDELYQLLSILDRNFMSWSAFMKKFCGLTFTPFGQDHSGATNLQYLNNWLFENIMVRREKRQVLSQLPPKMRQTIDLQEPPIKVEADSMFEMFSKSADVKSKDKRFREWLKELIEESSKIGLFAYHQTLLDAAQEICEELGYDYVRIDGNVDLEERHRRVMEFSKNPRCRVAILSIVCAGTGLNGLQVADTCAFLEGFWTPGSIAQAEDRFHRPGTKAESIFIKFPILTNFDKSLMRLILEKLGIIRRITSIEQIPDSVTDENLMATLAKEFGVPIKKGKGVI